MCLTDTYITPTGRGVAIFCLILNIFFPGSGTIVNAMQGEEIMVGIFIGIL